MLLVENGDAVRNTYPVKCLWMKRIQSEEAGSADEAYAAQDSGYHDCRLWGRGDQRRKQGKRRMGFLNKPFSVPGKLLSLI